MIRICIVNMGTCGGDVRGVAPGQAQERTLATKRRGSANVSRAKAARAKQVARSGDTGNHRVREGRRDKTRRDATRDRGLPLVKISEKQRLARWASENTVASRIPFLPDTCWSQYFLFDV